MLDNLKISLSHAVKTYKDQFESAIEGHEVIILWHFTIHTDRHIIDNRLDIVIKDYKQTKLPSYRYGSATR